MQTPSVIYRLLGGMLSHEMWANRVIFAAIESAPKDFYHKGAAGLVFRSPHGTMCHIAIASRLWLARITGKPTSTWALQHISPRRRSCPLLADPVRRRTRPDITGT